MSDGPPGASPSIRHLYQRVHALEARVRDAVERFRASEPDADDRFRGLYISDTEVDRLLTTESVPPAPDAEAAAYVERVEAHADADEANGCELALRQLGRSFGLDGYDLELLLVVLAPELDPRFERLYAYLHDDVSRRRASAGLALALCGAPRGSGPERRRLGPASPLVAGDLLTFDELERPFLTRPLRIPDRVVAHLLGDDAPDTSIAPLLTTVPAAATGDVELLVNALNAGIKLIYVREAAPSAGASLAAAALQRVGLAAVTLDLSRLATVDDVQDLARHAAREARLRKGALVAGPVEAVADRGAHAVRAFGEADGTVVLTGARAWDPAWSHEVPFTVEATMGDDSERRRLWLDALEDDQLLDADPVAATQHFRLAPQQIHRAGRAARVSALATQRPLTPADLCAGARAQNGAGLDRLARRIEPRSSWDDLVLPASVSVQLRELVARVRQRDHVLDDWGMGATSSKGRGIKALFAGDSGTGKTMSAEVVARELGLDLYVIDLSTVVDKYVGETEKNLDRIFGEADRINGVLLFDEADALFGKRSEVKDAQDRYANVEVAYLLQRMEQFEGLAVLTTNLRSNLDEAFSRRLDALVDFPMPDEADRRRLWTHNLAGDAPQADDIDLRFLAAAFKLSGGSIRNVVLGAAFLAAEQNQPIAMADLIKATAREYRKLGHLCAEAEFGAYFALISSPRD